MSAKYVSALRLNRETRRKSYVDQLEVMGEAFKLFDRTEEGTFFFKDTKRLKAAFSVAMLARHRLLREGPCNAQCVAQGT